MIIKLSLKDIEELVKRKMQLGIYTYYHWKFNELKLDKITDKDKDKIIVEIETYNYF